MVARILKILGRSVCNFGGYREKTRMGGGGGKIAVSQSRVNSCQVLKPVMLHEEIVHHECAFVCTPAQCSKSIRSASIDTTHWSPVGLSSTPISYFTPMLTHFLRNCFQLQLKLVRSSRLLTQSRPTLLWPFCLSVQLRFKSRAPKMSQPIRINSFCQIWLNSISININWILSFCW